MNRIQQIDQLQRLAQLMLDARLSALRAAAQARSQSQQRLADLDRPDAAEGLCLVAAQEVALRYQTWADLRRVEINQTLARQTADWIEARGAAKIAFGRAEALNGLGKKLAGRR